MPKAPHVPPELGERPFLGSAAVRSGLLSRRQLRSTAWRRVFRDVYVSAQLTIDQAMKVRAAALLLPEGAVLSGRTGAWVFGADVLRAGEDVDASVQLRVQQWATRPGLRVHRTVLDMASDVVRIADVPVTSPCRTAFDVARRESFVAAVCTLDALLRAKVVCLEDVLAYAEQRRCWPRAGLVPAVLAAADPLAESVMESQLRLLLVLAGLPRPTAQHEIFDEHGDVLARVDLAYREVKLAIEYDGRHHLEHANVLADLRRQNRLRAMGWTILRYTAEDVLRRPGMIIAQVRAALAG